jgi:hypothetical protein
MATELETAKAAGKAIDATADAGKYGKRLD